MYWYPPCQIMAPNNFNSCGGNFCRDQLDLAPIAASSKQRQVEVVDVEAVEEVVAAAVAAAVAVKAVVAVEAVAAVAAVAAVVAAAQV